MILDSMPNILSAFKCIFLGLCMWTPFFNSYHMFIPHNQVFFTPLAKANRFSAKYHKYTYRKESVLINPKEAELISDPAAFTVCFSGSVFSSNMQMVCMARKFSLGFIRPEHLIPIVTPS